MWCPVHCLWEYLSLRFGRKKEADPVFWTRHNNPLGYEVFRNQLAAMINTVNKLSPFTLNPAYYTPHCFRAGGCTELARQRMAASVIKKLGRWKSETWNQFYFSINFIDISIISGTPISTLLSTFQMVDF